MIDADKKFHGGRRYYHRHAETGRDVPVNPSWPERQMMIRKEKRLRLLRLFGLAVLCIAVVVGTFYLMSPGEQ